MAHHYPLNLFPLDDKKQRLETVLGIVIVDTVALSLFVPGWRWGLLAVFVLFILAGLFRTLAQTLAQRLLVHRTGVGDSSEELDVVDRPARGGRLGTVMEAMDSDRERRRGRLARLIRQPAIGEILHRYEVSGEEYEELFATLWVSDLHDLAWEIVSRPADLEELVRMKREGRTEAEIWRRFCGFAH